MNTQFTRRRGWILGRKYDRMEIRFLIKNLVNEIDVDVSTITIPTEVKNKLEYIERLKYQRQETNINIIYATINMGDPTSILKKSTFNETAWSIYNIGELRRKQLYKLKLTGGVCRVVGGFEIHISPEKCNLWIDIATTCILQIISNDIKQDLNKVLSIQNSLYNSGVNNDVINFIIKKFIDLHLYQ